jgi:Uma2 family endonuclease
MSAVDFAPDLLEPARYSRHRVNVADYHRMAEAGVLAADARVELIEGEVIDMAPMGSRHYLAVRLLNRILIEAVSGRAELACQLPVRLSDFSEPVPDFSIVRLDAALGVPSGHETLLAIEIADSSLGYDARIKAPLYARHGVLEYWVIDLVQQRLLRFADARDGAWQTTQALARPGHVPLPGLPGIEIDLAPVF